MQQHAEEIPSTLICLGEGALTASTSGLPCLMALACLPCYASLMCCHRRGRWSTHCQSPSVVVTPSLGRSLDLRELPDFGLQADGANLGVGLAIGWQQTTHPKLALQLEGRNIGILQSCIPRVIRPRVTRSGSSGGGGVEIG